MVEKLSYSVYTKISILLVIILFGCQPNDYSSLPAYSTRHFLQAVIVNPAGTNLKTFYCAAKHRFRVRMDEGAEQKVTYLAYPANFGFIPSVRINNVDGENGVPLDVMVISKQLEIGDIVEIKPIGMIILQDEFSTNYRVIAVPVDPELQSLDAGSLQELRDQYPGVTEIIETWFLNSSQDTGKTVLGWEDEHAAQRFIDKWVVKLD